MSHYSFSIQRLASTTICSASEQKISDVSPILTETWIYCSFFSINQGGLELPFSIPSEDPTGRVINGSAIGIRNHDWGIWNERTSEKEQNGKRSWIGEMNQIQWNDSRQQSVIDNNFLHKQIFVYEKIKKEKKSAHGLMARTLAIHDIGAGSNPQGS